MKRILYGILGVIVVAAAVAALACVAVFVRTRRFEPPRQVSIQKGESLTTAARSLAQAGVINSEIAFVLYAKASGGARRVKPGDYAFAGNENTPAVLEHLINGDFLVVTVTIPEGMTLHQIGQRIGEGGLLCDYTFDEAATVGTVPRTLGLGSLGAEGFLFPATYRFPPHATPDQVVAAMLARFYEILTPPVEQRLFELGLTARQMVTMASIVEKEAHAPGERPLIAGVFYNRLRLGMPLQSDPTAEYQLDGAPESAATAGHNTADFNTS